VQERRVEPALTSAAVDRRPLAARYAVLAAVAAAAVALDQVTKTWAEHALRDRTIHLFWTFQLNLSFNTGAAFGVGRGFTPYLVVGAVVVFIVLIAFSRSVPTLARAIAMGLVLGGACGNLVDRLFRGNGGAVIDFIDPQWWPVFNVADAAISCGAVLLIVSATRA
jgi:signal peptidase II